MDDCISIRKSIIGNFQQIAEHSPNDIALRYNEVFYTYKELHIITNKIAKALKKKGLQEKEKVLIYLPHNDWYVCTILAVLKCKCTYIPIDRSMPLGRVKHILFKYKINTIIQEEIQSELASIRQCTYKDLVQENEEYLYEENSLDLEQDAYIMFTSGSTGEPKGIPIKQKSILNLLVAYKKNLVFDHDVQRIHFLLCASFGFDMSVLQIYYPLLTGEILDVLPIAKKENLRDLVEYLSIHEIDVMDITPLFLDALKEFLISNSRETVKLPKYFISSGEALPLAVVQDVFALPVFQATTILNSYGPTEACVYTSVYPITFNSYRNINKMLIGKPIDNMHIYILNDDNNICQIEEEGELYITGIGLSEGYYEQDEKTKESFIHIPRLFGDQVAYKTGDFGYYVDSGDIYYLGRKDNQIKIRGYRIELGEIQYQIEKLDQVKRCIVTTQGELTNKKIVAYFISDQKLSLSYFKENLRDILPHYMMPNYFVPIRRFEYNVRGKIDKSRLPSIKKYALQETKHVAKECIQDYILEKIIMYSKEILECDTLTEYSNFLEAGGNSIHLYLLSIKIEEEWRIRITISELFRTETISDIASIVREKCSKSFLQKECDKQELVVAPTTAFQRLLFTEERKSKRIIKRYNLREFPMYNVIYRIEMDEYIDYNRLKESLKSCIEKIDAFNIIFVNEENNIVMRKSLINFNECCMLQKCSSTRDLDVIRSYIKIFDITKTPLFQIIVFEDLKGEQALVLNFHHAIFDYYSLHIFMRKLFGHYYNKELIECENSFFNYTSKYYSEDKTKYFDFWKKYYLNRNEPVFISGDILENGLHNMAYFEENTFYIEGMQYIQLRNACKQLKVSEYLFTFTVFALMICSMTNVEDIIIGTYINSRGQEFLHSLNTIGLITSLVGIRFHEFMYLEFGDYIQKLHKEFIEVIENMGIDFNEIYTILNEDEIKQGKLFYITYNYIIQGDIYMKELGHKFNVQEIGEEPISIPFGLKGYQDNEKITFKLKYCSQIYSKEYIQKFVDNYTKFIDLYSKSYHLEINFDSVDEMR